MRLLTPVNDGSGWTCAAAAATSQPVRSSRAALRKASHAIVSASATSVVTTVSATVTRTWLTPLRSSDAISAEAIAGSAASLSSLGRMKQVRDPLARLDELRRRRLNVLRAGGGDRLLLPLIPHRKRHIVSLEFGVSR